MKDPAAPYYLINEDAPLQKVVHANLTRYGESRYKSTCPACPEGILLVGRDQETFELLEHDRCIVCAQLVQYEDIAEMRAREQP